MQLGISTYTYGWAIGMPGNRPNGAPDEQALLDRAKAFAVSLVQFGDNWPLHERTPAQLTALRDRAGREGITIEVGARGLTESHLRRYIDLTCQLGSRLLRFVIDVPGYEPAVADIVALLRNALPVLEQANVTLGIENHDRLLAREFADIVERVGSPTVGICLDTVNSMGAGEGLTEVVQTLAPYTVNLHVKDFGISRLPHLMGFQIDGRPAGRGMLTIPWLVDQVRRAGQCRTAVLEQWVVPDADLSDTIAKEAAWATESMAYLQQTGLFTEN